MYFETKLIKDARLSVMNDEELMKLLNEAADKTNQDPDSFFIFPFSIYSDYIFGISMVFFLFYWAASEFCTDIYSTSCLGCNSMSCNHVLYL